MNQTTNEQPFAKFDYTLTFDHPLDPVAWDELAHQNGNLIQSTFYDPILRAPNNRPIYFEVRSNHTLVAGLKLFEFVSQKNFLLRRIGRNYFQYGEILHREGIDVTEPIALLKKNILSYVKSMSPAYLKVSGFYGNVELLLDMNSAKKNEYPFNVIAVDLNRNIDECFNSLRTATRQGIRKAEKMLLEFCVEDNLDAFVSLLHETYRNQEKPAPHRSFLNQFYSTLYPLGFAQLFFVKQNGNPLAAALVSQFGNVAYYEFAGTVRNQMGAGSYLQWNIMKHLKADNISTYNLGQVATQRDDENLKFTEGISWFKRSFGGYELSSASRKIILSPFKNNMWETLLKLTGRK